MRLAMNFCVSTRSPIAAAPLTGGLLVQRNRIASCSA